MKYSITITLFVLCSFVFSNMAIARESKAMSTTIEREYCILKESGRYHEALSVLGKASNSTTDEKYLEIIAFRIHEICDLPELIPKGREVLDSMTKLAAVQKSTTVSDRIDLFRAELALRAGELSTAKRIIDSFSFFDFNVIGPFKNVSTADFDRPTAIEKLFRKDQHIPGKFTDLQWFAGTSTLLGSINMDTLLPGEKDVFYYFHRFFRNETAGNFCIKLGKTGFVDIWVDGIKIFSDRNQHGFAFDQYTIPLALPKGTHRILVKIGDSRYGVECAVRIANSSGGRALLQTSSGPSENVHVSPSSILRSRWNDLAEKYRLDAANPDARFFAGYLAYQSKLYCSAKDLGPFFSSIPKTSPYHSSALFYLGNVETTDEQKAFHYKSASTENPHNMEALFALASLKIRHHFFREAIEIIHSLKSAQNITYLHDLAMLRLCEGMGWTDEALKTARALKSTSYPTWGLFYEAKLNYRKGDMPSALRNYTALYESDRMNRTYLMRTVRCHDRMGSTDRASALLHAALNYYPSDMQIRLRLARITEMQQGCSSALGYISSAARISPYNKQVIAALGILYHKLGNRTMAHHHLGLAVSLDPENFQLRNYFEYVTKNAAICNRLAIRPDIEELRRHAENYPHESAVILLDETIFNVLSDGSYEKKIRRIIKLNDAKSLEEYKNYYVTYEPEFEKIENLECIHYRDGIPYRIMEKFTKSMSDHRNRLYYKTEVLIIPITASAPGSIIDISYIQKNRGGADYKNYFGEKIFMGGPRRILLQRILLRHPAEMKMHCHLRGIPDTAHTVTTEGKHVLHNIELRKTSPYVKEGSMPDPSTFLPSVCFTTFGTWDEFYNWYMALLRNKIRITPDMKLLLAKTIKAGDAPIEKTRAIYRLLASEIRYVGFESGLGGIQPRSTDTTFNSRMGDCKDVSLLLAAMLRECGIDACLALVRTKERGAADLSSAFIGEFNHALCYVNLDGGFFLDATTPYSGIRELPYDDRGLMALLIEENGHKFVNTGHDYYFQETTESHNDVSLQPDGSGEIRRIVKKSGDHAAVGKIGQNRQKKVRNLTEFWNRHYPGSTISEFKELKSDFDQPYEYSYKVSVPLIAELTKDFMIMPSVTPTNNFNGLVQLEKRTFPLVLSQPVIISATNIIRFPGAFSIEKLPRNEAFENPKFKASYRYTLHQREIHIEYSIKIPADELTPDEYLQFREFVYFICRKESERILFRKGPHQ